MMTLEQASSWLPSARLVGDPGLLVNRVHSDTRTLQPGDLFVALQGERFDANDFFNNRTVRADGTSVPKPTRRRHFFGG